MQVKRDKKTMVAFVALAVLVVALLGAAGVFAKMYYDLRANPTQAQDQEREQLVEEISRVYELPKDEQPIVGEVQDKSKLKDQPFFKNAQNGDKILIYKEARLAIIYRADADKLINVGPIAIDAAPQGQGNGGGNQNTQPAEDQDATTTEEATTEQTTP